MHSDQPLVYTGERYSFDKWLITEHNLSCAPLRIDGELYFYIYSSSSTRESTFQMLRKLQFVKNLLED